LRRRAARAPAALAWLALLAGCLGLTASAASAKPGWGKPFELTKPGSLDYTGPQLAYSAHGLSAATFSVGDVDTPGAAQAYLVGRSAGGKVGKPRAVSGAREVLSLAYDSRPLKLLVGSSPQGQDCCSTAEAVSVSPTGGLGKPQALVGGLTGHTQGQLLALAGGQMMAAVATERGVWVTQSFRAGRFGSPHLVSDKGQEPIAMSAAWLGGGASIVAWTAGTGVIGATTPRSIFDATGTRKQAPHHARVAITVPSGHRIDELAVARHGTGETLAWIESWYDAKGTYHSRVEASDLDHQAKSRALSPDDRLASGLTFASDADGDEGLAWESCTTFDSCSVQASGRPAKGSFGQTKTLGPIDAYQSPALTISSQGQIVIAWVRGGHPVASAGFGAPAVLSSTTFATEPAVDFGPRNEAMAAWIQGTLNPSVVAAAYHNR
jgi:hypothetical protein